MAEVNQIIQSPVQATPLTVDQKLDKILVLAVNTSEDVKDIKTRLVNVESTVAGHTTVLDDLAKNVKTLFLQCSLPIYGLAYEADKPAYR